jgi:hypothetical protein
MLLSLYSWDGNLINDGANYTAHIPPGQAMPAATPEYVNRGQNWPLLAGKTLSGATFTFQIVFKGTIHTQLEELKKWFPTNDYTLRNLVAKDTSDSDRTWYVQGFPIQPPLFTNSNGAASVFVTLAIKEPFWRESTQQTDTWSVAASGATRAISVRGNSPTAPIIEITPTGAKAGTYAYRRYAIVYNPIDKPFNGYPLNLVGDLNTATLIAGGKMQADGDDLRVNIDGRQVSRWFGGGGINSTTTRVFANISLRPRIELSLAQNIALSGLSDIVVKPTDANIKALKELPDTGAILIDNEVILYTDVNVAKRKITPSMRAAMNTTAATHTAGATIRWIEHTILIYYGNAAVTAPAVNDEVAPMFVLDADSSNTQWKFNDFADVATATRRARWTSIKKTSAGNASYPYYGDHGSLTDDPAVEAGALIASYKQAGVQRNGQGDISWQLYNPAGFTNISASGEKYRKNVSWPTAAFRKSVNGDDYTDVATIATPASANTWTAWSTGSVALGAGYFPYLRMRFNGTVNAGVDAYSALEMSTITVQMTASRVPVVTLKAEQDNYYLEVTITNNTTGDSFTVACVMGLNETVYVDCENLRCYNTDGQWLHGALELNTKRQDFLTLMPGSNTLQYDDTGTTAVTVVTKWRGWNFI